MTFTYDKAWAEHLAEKWRHVAPVKIGGVAYGDKGAEFVPGRYIKPGYIFTSRGCPRRCWFCSVWKRDPVPRLLPVVVGWNILDDNLLACPRDPDIHARVLAGKLSLYAGMVEAGFRKRCIKRRIKNAFVRHRDAWEARPGHQRDPLRS